MTDTAHGTDNSPSHAGEGCSRWEQLHLVQLSLTDLLFDAHASGTTLDEICAAWLWLDALAASSGA